MDMNEFDKLYVGSSPIMMLDALNSSLKAEKVLIIDKDIQLGGAWKGIDLFGFRNLENAVHYLLPNKEGYNFLQKYFNIELEDSSRKFYAVRLFGIKVLLSVRNGFGRMIYFLNGGDQGQSNKLSIINLFKTIYHKF